MATQPLSFRAISNPRMIQLLVHSPPTLATILYTSEAPQRPSDESCPPLSLVPDSALSTPYDNSFYLQYSFLSSPHIINCHPNTFNTWTLCKPLPLMKAAASCRNVWYFKENFWLVIFAREPWQRSFSTFFNLAPLTAEEMRRYIGVLLLLSISSICSYRQTWNPKRTQVHALMTVHYAYLR